LVIGPRDVNAVVEDQVQRNVARYPGRWTDAQIALARANLVASYQTDLERRIDESANILRQNLDVIGVLSLSEANNDLTMWAHYADNHHGFVIEFDTSHAPLVQQHDETGWQGRPAPVQYRQERPRVHCDSLELQLPDELVLVKTINWQYEREWRVVRDRGGVARTLAAATVSLFRVDARAISGIHLGKDASAATEQRLRAAVGNNGALAHTRITRGRMSTRGEVVFA
jgi:hypothetical protein